MMSKPAARYAFDSATVENCGPSMHTYVPPRCTVAPASDRRVVHDVAQRSAERVREADVRDEAVAEERAHAAARPIEELIRHDEVQRLVVFTQAADRARRQNPLDAEES